MSRLWVDMVDLDALRSHLTRRMPAAMDALRQMVGTNSFTHNAVGVNAVGDLTQALFEPLGFIAKRPQAIECTQFEQPPLGRHLLLSRAAETGPRIGLVGHLDTVFTEAHEAANDFRWREVGDRIYGPGTVDIKGGNVVMWMVVDALRTIAPDIFDRVDWRIMFNAAEEGLASDFGLLARRQMGHHATACLIFEGGGLEGETHRLISHRKGSIGLLAVARGRAAHAGGRHEHGANAVVQLCHIIPQLHAITDYSQDLTCNVGVVRGGSVVNQVPDHAEALIEIRAYDPAILQAAFDQAMALNGQATITSAEDGYAASVELTCRIRHAPWPINAGSEAFGRIVRACGERIGLEVECCGRGGLSDGNFLWDLVPTLDGFGPAGANLHCAARNEDGTADQEYVLPATFVPRAMLAILAIERLLENPLQTATIRPLTM